MGATRRRGVARRLAGVAPVDTAHGSRYGESMLFDSLPRPSERIAPGVAHLPGWLGVDKQSELVREVREIARRYADTPMAMVRPTLKSGGQMSVYQLHLGRYWHYPSYRYVDKIAGTTVPPVPKSKVLQ